MNWRRRQLSSVLAISASLLAVPAVAGEFEWGDWEGSFNSQISFGASWRMSDIEPLLVTPGNTRTAEHPAGWGQASTGTADDGNLNYEDGDAFSVILKGIHDLELRNGDFGVFLRGKYWYDMALADDKLPHGNSANQYISDQSLDDSGFDDFAQASGLELLDAFVYGTFYLGESGMPLDLRLGRQVASWGESTFIQNGINVINPIDVSAFRRPGAEIKEGLLPVAMATVSIGLTDALSFDAFYQIEWEKTVIDGCGTYFSTADVAATGCNMVTLTGAASDRQNITGIPDGLGGWALPPGYFITRLPDVEPDDSGQFGVSFRYFAEKLAGTEFGIYYMNYHSRTPYLGGYTESNRIVPIEMVPPPLIKAVGYPLPPFIPGNPYGELPIGGNAQYFAEFPEDIEMWGASFATNLAGFAISGEVSYRPDFPVQINTTELLHAAVLNAPWSTLTPTALAVDPGSPFSGYDLLPVTQAQVTFIRFFDQVFGASRLSVAAEFGGNWVGSLPEQSEQRYGRSPTYGMGWFEPIALPIPGAFITCEDGFAGIPGLVDPIPPANSNDRNCTTDGYVTDSSWGYRIRAGLTYNDVFAGINLTPALAWSHDVDGYSPNSNFNEGAKALSVSLGAEYLNRYTASLSYTDFSGGDYNTVEDRDFLSMSFSVSF